MAVIDDVPHVTARVRVAGELATEYEAPDASEMANDPSIEEDPTPSKHCYIECKSGADFAIEVTITSDLKVPKENDRIGISVYIDGTFMNPMSAHKHKLRLKGQVTQIISSPRCVVDAERAVLKKFVFAPITKHDSASKEKIEEDVLRAKGLGTIQVVVKTSKMSKNSPSQVYSHVPTGEQPDFAEKALKGKGISHATTFTETGGVVPRPVLVDVENQIDIGEFFFHYRSHEALQHEMVISRTPSPEPPIVSDDGEDVLSRLSESEIRRLAMERLRDNNVKQESSGIKREADETTPAPRLWKFAKLDNGKEAVDLTDE